MQASKVRLGVKQGYKYRRAVNSELGGYAPGYFRFISQQIRLRYDDLSRFGLKVLTLELLITSKGNLFHKVNFL